MTTNNAYATIETKILDNVLPGQRWGITTPDWVKHSVFYQIFPDRFSRSPRLKHPPGIRFQPWGAPPTARGFQGGDLLGVVDRLDYLEELGVNALYLNPIFSSASNHRYHTYDYFQVDPLLGGEAAFRELLDEAHARAMRVIIDGVFNHTGRGLLGLPSHPGNKQEFALFGLVPRAGLAAAPIPLQ